MALSSSLWASADTAALTSWFKSTSSTQQRGDAAVADHSISDCTLTADDVRVVIFGQTRHQSRKLLFDSRRSATSAAPKAASRQSRLPKEPLKSVKSHDVDILSEVVFGSIPSGFSATTTKLHDVIDPPQLIATLLFNGLATDDVDSSLESPRASTSPQSIMMRHRHFFENHLDPAPDAAASPPHHRSRYVSTTPQLLIGVSLVVSTAKTPSFGAFSRQNFGLLEHLLFSIKAHVLANTLVAPREIHLDGHTFGFQANDRFALVVGELRERFRARFAAPRLETPAWLAVRRGAPVKHLATADLAELLHTFSGTARSKHFVAKALTAVLTHHASWISTVLPLRLAWTDRQEAAGRVALRELYGVTPQLAEITRTVVVGKNAASVRQMLRVISFFLRCSRPCPLFPNESTAGDGGGGGDDCTVDSDSDGTPSCHDRPEPVATPVCDSPSDVTKLADFERVLLEPHDARAGATSGDVRSEVLAGSFGDVCCSLVPFLVLQGLTKMPTMKAVADDLCQHYSYSIVQCPIECARCIFIDIDKLSVDLVDVQRVSRDGGETDELTYHVEVLEQASLGVQRVLMGFLGCHDLMLPSQVCLEQLEGGLRELCIASEILALCNRPPLVEAPSLPPGIDASDVSLLEAIGRYTAQSESV